MKGALHQVVQVLALLLLAGFAVVKAGGSLEAAKAEFLQRFPEYGYQGRIDALWNKVGLALVSAWPLRP